jgi:hypothetical protein
VVAVRDRLRGYWWRFVRPRYEVFVTYGPPVRYTGIEGLTEGGAKWVGFFLLKDRAIRAALDETPAIHEPHPQIAYVYRLNRADEYGTKVEIAKRKIL